MSQRAIQVEPPFGVRRYWLVDPRLRTLEILKLNDDAHYTTLASASKGVVGYSARRFGRT